MIRTTEGRPVGSLSKSKPSQPWAGREWLRRMLQATIGVGTCTRNSPSGGIPTIVLKPTAGYLRLPYLAVVGHTCVMLPYEKIPLEDTMTEVVYDQLVLGVATQKLPYLTECHTEDATY